jgi:molybdate transport system substrate-binding protein
MALLRSLRQLQVALLVGCAWASSAFGADAKPLTGKLLFLCAASTTEAIDELKGEFRRLHPGVTVRTSYAASSTLAQQISAGAEADLFLSASSQWSTYLEEKQLVARQRDLLSNQLVIVTLVESKLEIQSPADLTLTGVRHVALADPKSVPAGVYAKQALVRLDLWDKLKKKVVGAADVRQALHFVESGAAEAAIVYATDVVASQKVKLAARLDLDLSDPIRYPLVLLKRSADSAAAVALYDFLLSRTASDIFRRHGFAVLTPRQR